MLSLNVAGVDVISPNISKPWHETGAIINEVNYAPLLGGGAISHRHISLFLDRFIPADGRIPVEVFAGGEAAWRAASERWQTLKGRSTYLTNATHTIAPSGDAWIMPFTSLHQRVRALLLSAEVGGIVMVVQTDEFLYSGLPLPSVDAVTTIDTNFTAHRAGTPCQREATANLLAGWVSP